MNKSFCGNFQPPFAPFVDFDGERDDLDKRKRGTVAATGVRFSVLSARLAFGFSLALSLRGEAP